MKRAYQYMAVATTLMMLLGVLAVGVALAGSAPGGTAGCCPGGAPAGSGGAAGAGGGATGGAGDGVGPAAGSGVAGVGVGSGGAGGTSKPGSLTLEQEYTYDTFSACAAGYRDARIDKLAPNGSFTFSTGMPRDGYAIKDCMVKQGFKFDW